MGNLSFSELESKRFNLKIFRGVLEAIDENKLKNTILQHEADILIFRTDVLQIGQQQLLHNLGFDYIVADTLSYYTLSLQQTAIKTLKNANLDFVQATDKHKTILSDLVSRTFANYTSHYSSNWVLNKDAIREGYKEWAKNYIHSDINNNRITWLARKNNSFVGFATCSFDKEENICEGVLYGVCPDASGSGVYNDMIKYTANYFKQEGFEKMRTSTQIQNMAVQKVWVREGFVLSDAYNTYHINSLLSKSISKPIETVLHVNDVFLKEHQYVSIPGTVETSLPDTFIQQLFWKEVLKNDVSLHAGSYTFKFIKFTSVFINQEYRMILTNPLEANAHSGKIIVGKLINIKNEITCILYVKKTLDDTIQ